MSHTPQSRRAAAWKLLLAGSLVAGSLAASLPAFCPAAGASGASGESAGAVTIGFDQVPGGAFSHYTESGFTLKAPRASGWMGATGYGNPAPFIDFNVPANTTTTAHLYVTENGSTFTFKSVDLYASDNPVTYTFKGSLNGTVIYSVRGNTGNLYGAFLTFFNRKKNSKTLIDSLEITMTDAQSIGDLAGLDNIVVVPASAKTN